MTGIFKAAGAGVAGFSFLGISALGTIMLVFTAWFQTTPLINDDARADYSRWAIEVQAEFQPTEGELATPYIPINWLVAVETVRLNQHWENADESGAKRTARLFYQKHTREHKHCTKDDKGTLQCVPHTHYWYTLRLPDKVMSDLGFKDNEVAWAFDILSAEESVGGSLGSDLVNLIGTLPPGSKPNCQTDLCREYVEKYLPILQAAVVKVSREKGKNYSEAEVDSLVRLLVAMTSLESDFDPNAINDRNTNGTIDYGLMQVNSIHIPSGMNPREMLNPAVNIEMGTRIFFDKFNYVQYDTSRLWEAVACYNGCKQGSDGHFSAVQPVYLDIVKKKYALHWGDLSGGTSGWALMPASGPGFWRYEPDTHTWGTPRTIGLLTSVFSQWNKTEPVHPIGVGDISLYGGGPFPAEGRSTSHQEGRDVDMLPVRKDGRKQNVTWQESGYDQERTQKLVNLLLETGEVRWIFFNDPHVTGVKYLDGHDNHLHVSFKPPRTHGPLE